MYIKCLFRNPHLTNVFRTNSSRNKPQGKVCLKSLSFGSTFQNTWACLGTETWALPILFCMWLVLGSTVFFEDLVLSKYQKYLLSQKQEWLSSSVSIYISALSFN